MHKFFSKFGALRQLCVPAAFLLVPVSANAQSQGARDTIEEIQVTATRRQMKAADVSASLTVVTSEDIAAGNLVTDALMMQPGVFLQQTTAGQGAAIIRGLKGSEILHLVDGMRLNNAIFRNAPTQYLALVAPGTLERLEVVRGAPTSLYGSDAVGGVVQAISRIPQFDERGVQRAAYLSFATADLARILRASVDFGDEKLAALISGETLSSGNLRTGSGSRIGPSAYDAHGGRIALSATPDEDRSWLFDLQFARQPQTPRTDELIPGFGQTEPASAEFFFAPNERAFGHVRHVRQSWIWDATWNFDLAWQRIVDDRISRGLRSALRRLESNSSDLFGLTVNASGETDSGSWVTGAEIYYDKVASERTEENLLNGQSEIVRSRFPDGSTMGQAAIFGNLLRHLGERNTLSGGLRFSAIDTRLAAANNAASSSSKQQDVSADIGWLLDLSDLTQLTTNLGFGFRAPNVFDLGTLGERPGNRFNIPNPDLVSERITHFDVGVRHRRDHLDIDVVLFALHYTDRISSVLTGETTPAGRDVTQSRNIQEANIYGMEAAFRWQLSSALRVDVVLNVLRGEQTEESSLEVAADRIPPFNGRLALRYQWTDSLWIEPYIFFAGDQDRLSPRDINDNRINPDGTPGWTTLNLRSSWQLNDALTMNVQLENVFDRHYRVHGSGIDASGRNFMLSMQVNW